MTDLNEKCKLDNQCTRLRSAQWMLFTEIWEILEPFLRGAARRPKEAPIQKGSRIFNMAMSYYNISLDHLAEHMIHLSTASSFWFSLNSSYDNEFHLSKRLGTSPPAGCRIASLRPLVVPPYCPAPSITVALAPRHMHQREDGERQCDNQLGERYPIVSICEIHCHSLSSG